jgi:hypothetical protein
MSLLGLPPLLVPPFWAMVKIRLHAVAERMARSGIFGAALDIGGEKS